MPAVFQALGKAAAEEVQDFPAPDLANISLGLGEDRRMHACSDQGSLRGSCCESAGVPSAGSRQQLSGPWRRQARACLLCPRLSARQLLRKCGTPVRRISPTPPWAMAKTGAQTLAVFKALCEAAAEEVQDFHAPNLANTSLGHGDDRRTQACCVRGSLRSSCWESAGLPCAGSRQHLSGPWRRQAHACRLCPGLSARQLLRKGWAAAEKVQPSICQISPAFSGPWQRQAHACRLCSRLSAWPRLRKLGLPGAKSRQHSLGHGEDRRTRAGYAQGSLRGRG